MVKMVFLIGHFFQLFSKIWNYSVFHSLGKMQKWENSHFSKHETEAITIFFREFYNHPFKSHDDQHPSHAHGIHFLPLPLSVG